MRCSRSLLLIALACTMLLAGPPVRDEKTAVALARTALIAAFGKSHVAQFEPYHAKDKGNVWIVYGTPPRRGPHGGAPEARVAYSDGRVLQVSHGR